jgi:hypothetical protein
VTAPYRERCSTNDIVETRGLVGDELLVVQRRKWLLPATVSSESAQQQINE